MRRVRTFMEILRGACGMVHKRGCRCSRDVVCGRTGFNAALESVLSACLVLESLYS
jgi:hypothetical protein